MKYTTRHTTGKQVDWNGQYVSIIDRIEEIRYDFFEKMQDEPTELRMNPYTYRKLMRDNRITQFTYTPMHNDPPTIFGIEITISKWLEDNVIIPVHRRDYGPFNVDTRDGAVSFMYAMLDATLRRPAYGE